MTVSVQALWEELHDIPELAFQEHRTAAVVARALSEAGIEFGGRVAGTGVLGRIDGSREGRTVLVRADMDALPIGGVSHACGHDAHVAILLEVARRLRARRETLAGGVLLAFQPAEETGEGAKAMLPETGVQRVDAVIGLHLWQDLPVGTVGLRDGIIMSGSQRFLARFRGPGGHGAMPHLAPNPIFAASQFVAGLDGLAARRSAPGQVRAVSAGRIASGDSSMGIPEQAEVEGLVRSCDRSFLAGAETWLATLAEGVSRVQGTGWELEHEELLPPLDNDAELVARVRRELPPAVRVERPEQSTWADDFSAWSRLGPVCFLLIGSSNEAKGLTGAQHSEAFAFDQDALPIGVDVLESAIVGCLA
ncbi:MAG: M20 metallopeptidase family protein [Chloroflexota bacterium]